MGIDLFAPYRIGKLDLCSRFMRSATWDGTAAIDGAVTDASVALFKGMADSGIGLIVTGYAFVSLPGQAVYRQYGLYADDLIPGLRRLTDAVHRGDSKIALQIVHAGISASNHFDSALAVSVVPRIQKSHREMTEEEIEDTISDFAAAAVRAREAGFDAVQLHGAHGYLMSQFLSPSLNIRTDKWGGSLENRSRFHLEVIHRIRRAVGDDYTLLVKFGIRDVSAHGLSLAEGLQVARWLVAAGVDAIEVSVGVGSVRSAIPIFNADNPERPVFRNLAAALKKVVNVPVMLVGGIRTRQMAQEIVDSGDADMVSMCRPFIREPDLLRRWRDNGARASCVSCNQCLDNLHEEGNTLVCPVAHSAMETVTDA